MLSLVRTVALALVMLAGSVINLPLRAQEAPADAPAAAQDGPPPVMVQMKENRYHPARITVPVGTTVVWTNEDYDSGENHDVIARDFRWASDVHAPGETYEHTFTEPGTYRYFCDLHGGMVGQVIVE